MSETMNSAPTAPDLCAAYMGLEEQIRELRYMASIASDFICNLQLERKGDKRVTLSEDALEHAVFAVNKTSQMAEDLDKAYLARAK